MKKELTEEEAASDRSYQSLQKKLPEWSSSVVVLRTKAIR